MTEKLWKKIFAITIWVGSILGVFGLIQYVFYHLQKGNEVLYYSGSAFFVSGIFVLVISVVIAIGTTIYFIIN